MSAQMGQADYAPADVAQAIGIRIERVGWGLFLAMIGGLMLLPPGLLPEGTWLVGSGLILLGLNAARRLSGIPLSPTTVVLGLLALAAGIGAYLGVTLDLAPILLVVLGVALVVKQGYPRAA
jgi:hypothetical protein